MSQMDTVAMSTESRLAVNRATRNWLLGEALDIGAVCSIADIFGGKCHRKPVIQLRSRLRKYLNDALRCRKPQHGAMVFCRAVDIPPGEPGWKLLSNLALSTFVGMCHTTEIKRKKNEREKAATDETRSASFYAISKDVP